MDDIFKRAGVWGFDTEYRDAFGRMQSVDAAVFARLLEEFPETVPGSRAMPRSIVLRRGSAASLALSAEPGVAVRWTVTSEDRVIAEGQGVTPAILLPSGIADGIFRLAVEVETPSGPVRELAALVVCPDRAYQGSTKAPRRMWALAFQLYAVRSRSNWGHGDFGDLLTMIDLAADLGAAAVALNPLHALFDDTPEQASPYSPSSRLFLNPLYIDLGAVPDFPGAAAAGLTEQIDKLRTQTMVDYRGVGDAKHQALRLAFDRFRSARPERRSAFESFRQERGAVLARFASYEVLRRKFKRPWWEWPHEWRAPDDVALERLRASDPEVEFHEFVQWLADQQLDRCWVRAAERGMPIGLYLDVAVGVRSDGFDAWYDQPGFLRRLTIGAPPDILNTAGQSWGLASFDPVALETQGFAPFRRMLEASMRYAGAIRIDHVLGLKRLYVIPEGESAVHGAYLRFPFEAMLAVTALLSVHHRCIVIGEDLGTVPENFRETMADWGLWSCQLMLFERGHDGAFAAPETYRENALVSFGTHDLPTFTGWKDQHDLGVKAALGIDPGESREERHAAVDAMRRALHERGLGDVEFSSVARYLRDTPCRLMVVAIEDVLEVPDQVNVPGTIDQHPNWRRRLPVALEDLGKHRELTGIAEELAGERGKATE